MKDLFSGYSTALGRTFNCGHLDRTRGFNFLGPQKNFRRNTNKKSHGAKPKMCFYFNIAPLFKNQMSVKSVNG